LRASCGRVRDALRATKRYCSDICRVQAWRRQTSGACWRGTPVVRLTQVDGKLANLALMKLAAYHRDRGDEIVFTRSPYRDPFEPPL
jgi:hypothetical protein